MYEVDCRPLNMDGRTADNACAITQNHSMPSSDLGANPLTTFPANVAIVRLSGGRDLAAIDWAELSAVGPTLQVLEMSGNPKLNAIPPSGVYAKNDFPKLASLLLAKTNLSHLTDDTFQLMNRQSLVELDLSQPSQPGGTPLHTVSVNLTGFSNLSVVSWYNNRCPAGFYAASSTPARSDHTLCSRCPVETYSPGPGGVGKDASCAPCKHGYFDFDKDPTTPCTLPPKPFAVVNFTRVAPIIRRTGGGAQLITDQNPNQVYIVGVPYEFAPVHVLCSGGAGREDCSASDAVSYTKDETSRIGPGTPTGNSSSIFLIDPATGAMLGSPSLAGVFNVTLYAINDVGERGKVQTITITAVDPVPETLPPQQQTWLFIAVAAVSVLLLYSVTIVAVRERERRLKNTPFDFEAILAKLQEDEVVSVPEILPRPTQSVSGGDPHDGHKQAGSPHRSSQLDDAVSTVSSDGDAFPLLAKEERANSYAHFPMMDSHVEFDKPSASVERPLVLVNVHAQPTAGSLSPPTAEANLHFATDRPLRNIGHPGAKPPALRTPRLLPTLVRPREISKQNLNILKRIGGGNFGEVHDGMLDERASTGVPAYRVAIKTIKPDAQGTSNQTDLFEEAALMAQFDHPNIVALIGVVSRNQQCFVVLQLCDRGSLRALLQADAFDQGGSHIPEHVVLRIAAEIAAGMAYLEHKRYVHRDLAARNILVAADDTCLVADFGLSRALRTGADYYKIRQGTAMPIRWSAPELVVGARYTSSSDVWSFFVLMWEVFSRAQVPFGSKSDLVVVMILKDVTKGLIEANDILDKPAHVDDRLYLAIRAMCWHVDPARRATFTNLFSWLEQEKINRSVAQQHSTHDVVATHTSDSVLRTLQYLSPTATSATAARQQNTHGVAETHMSDASLRNQPYLSPNGGHQPYLRPNGENRLHQLHLRPNGDHHHQPYLAVRPNGENQVRPRPNGETPPYLQPNGEIQLHQLHLRPKGEIQPYLRPNGGFPELRPKRDPSSG